MSIRLATSDLDIRRCFPVMLQLRSQLGEGEFLERVRRQMATGYELALLEFGNDVKAVAGFRIHENLFRGRHMYIDDLVTDTTQRSAGFGGELLDWLARHATEQGCANLDLDSGVQRFEAHRFYFRHGMSIGAYHFHRSLEA